MNKYFITAITTAIIWTPLTSPAWTQPHLCDLTNSSPVSQSMNNIQQRNLIVIGKVSERPYVVVVPGNSEQLLNIVRKYISDAFITQNRLGAYIYAGGYANRFQAECWTHLLNSHGLDARVVYFH